MRQGQNLRGIALITGASEGIGWELARIMAADGWSLILTARREELLQRLADDLTARFDTEAYTHVADLSEADGINQLHDYTRSLGLTVEVLINNAGFGIIGSLKDTNADRINQLLQVNIISLTGLTRLFLPDMIMRGHGRVMNVGSVAGFIPMPLFAVYAASKAYVLSFTEALTAEIEGTGVTATLLAPGPTKTGFSRVAGYSQSPKPEYPRMRADVVARVGYIAMMAGKRVAVTGSMNKIITGISKSLPRRMSAKLAMKAMSRRIP